MVEKFLFRPPDHTQASVKTIIGRVTHIDPEQVLLLVEGVLQKDKNLTLFHSGYTQFDTFGQPKSIVFLCLFNTSPRKRQYGYPRRPEAVASRSRRSGGPSLPTPL